MRLGKVFPLTFTCLSAFVFIGQCAAAQTPARTLLISEKDGHQLNIVDPATLKILAKVPEGEGPHEVIASDDGKLAFIANPGGGSNVLHKISVVDLVAQTALPAIDTSPLVGVHGLDFSDGKLYFTAGPNNAIGRYDPATQKIDWVIGTGQGAGMVHVRKDLNLILTAGSPIGLIEMPAPTTGSQTGRGGQSWKVTTVPVNGGGGEEGVGISPDGKEIWAANMNSHAVTIVNVASKKMIVQDMPISVLRPDQLEFSPDGKLVVISGLGPVPASYKGTGGSVDVNDPNAISFVVIDVKSRKEIKQFKQGGGGECILMDPVGNRAFVSVTGANKVVIMDLNSLTITGEIPLRQPDGMAWAVRQ